MIIFTTPPSTGLGPTALGGFEPPFFNAWLWRNRRAVAGGIVGAAGAAVFALSLVFNNKTPLGGLGMSYTTIKKDGKAHRGTRLMSASEVRRMSEWATSYGECYVVKKVGTKQTFNVGKCRRPSDLSTLAGATKKRSKR